MKKWLTSLFLLFALAAGASAGAAPFAGGAENALSAAACCQRKTKTCEAKSVSAAQLCCAVNCNNPAPTSSPGASVDFSPSSVIIGDSILKQIALLLKREKPTQTLSSFSFEREVFSRKIQPEYLRNHSFLI